MGNRIQTVNSQRGHRQQTSFVLGDDQELRGAISESVIELMPEAVAREQVCLPLALEGDTLHVAYHDKNDVLTQDKLRFILNRNVQFHQRSARQIWDAINFYYGRVEGESADSLLQEFSDTTIDFTESVDYALSDMDCLTGRLDCLQPRDSSAHSLRSIQRRTRPGLTDSRESFSATAYSKGDGMFLYTVEEGQKAIAYRPGGEIEVVEGPRRLWKGFSRFVPMRHFVAHPGEYFIVRFHDGGQQNIKGPSQLWFDPRIHEEIEVCNGLNLAAKEAVVVYGEDAKDKSTGNENAGSENTIDDDAPRKASRRIVFGPGRFMPRPGEWLHDFSWHASRGGSRGAEKKPNGLQFQKLWLMPDQMYHDVRDVRTADDAVLVIRLMIFFELIDIEKMLDTTHDPIGDFINAATSDVVEFTGKRSFDSFKQQTEHLNDLATYSQLLHRAEQCGYKINNVVYRGYGAPDSLQKMHDEAIAARTSLQLDKETEKQTQELEDYRLQCQMERALQRRDEQENEVSHDILLQQKREQAQLDAKRLEQKLSIEKKRQDAGLANEITQLKDQQTRDHLGELKGLGVELTEFLTQGRADQVIELRGGGRNQPHLHINQNGKKRSASQ